MSKKAVLFVCLIVFASAAIDFAELLRQEEGDHKALFDAFRREYNKKYDSPEDEYRALQAFKHNLFHMFRHKAYDPTGKYAITKFFDMSPQDFQEHYLSPMPEIDPWLIPQKGQGSAQTLGVVGWLFGNEDDSTKTDDLPESFDWREKGVVTRVKSQLTCGSCWSFATTGVIEAQYALKTGELVEFSEQQLVDCDDLDRGCNGGLMTDAYQYLKDSWLETAEDYGPYRNRQQQCTYDAKLGKVKVKRYYQIQRDERAIQRELVKNGPVAVGINGRFLQFFDGGVLNPPECDSNLNHAVLIVGYGVDDQGTPYWTLKNQWGADWGEGGYFKLVRGQKRCGIDSYATIAFIN